MAGQDEHAECEELRQALQDMRARLNPPAHDTVIPGVQAPREVAADDTAPDADPEVWTQIRRIEQKMRELGCSE